MDIYLDNDRFQTRARTLGQVIDEAGQVLAERGRIVVEVRVDGQALSSERLTGLRQTMPEGEQLQLISAEPGELSRVTLMEARDALSEAARCQAEAAALLQADDVAGALDQVRQVLAIWSQARTAVDLTARMMGLALETVQVGQQTADQVVGELAGHLSVVKEQLEGQDWMGLADTLAYPLDESAGRWQRMLEVLNEQIKQGPAGAV